MAKRYEERTEKRPLAWPIPLGRPWYTTTVHDRKTGNTGRGEGPSAQESRRKAWKDLRERQGA